MDGRRNYKSAEKIKLADISKALVLVLAWKKNKKIKRSSDKNT